MQEQLIPKNNGRIQQLKCHPTYASSNQRTLPDLANGHILTLIWEFNFFCKSTMRSIALLCIILTWSHAPTPAFRGGIGHLNFAMYKCKCSVPPNAQGNPTHCVLRATLQDKAEGNSTLTSCDGNKVMPLWLCGFLSSWAYLILPVYFQIRCTRSGSRKKRCTWKLRRGINFL